MKKFRFTCDAKDCDNFYDVNEGWLYPRGWLSFDGHVLHAKESQGSALRVAVQLNFCPDCHKAKLDSNNQNMTIEEALIETLRDHIIEVVSDSFNLEP